MTKNLPRDLTSYDFLKAVAVLLMVIDHVGFYFYPDQQWFRVFGRLCVPIWFFLIGYARSRDLSLYLWGGMILLVFAQPAGGDEPFTSEYFRDDFGGAACAGPAYGPAFGAAAGILAVYGGVAGAGPAFGLYC